VGITTLRTGCWSLSRDRRGDSGDRSRDVDDGLPGSRSVSIGIDQSLSADEVAFRDTGVLPHSTHVYVPLTVSTTGALQVIHLMAACLAGFG